ncbi:uncharacterized protein LOC115232231 [Octopus sinensis]|uniref:Uncharacterized protein LOC115232231 n=1 Tax=Octopus sinensis TaxID=2607531 RepID=A0A6P7UAE8_9MOLL|nr:uncharacterized protein LOC115232231 [Octopus sinensis]
MEGYEYLGVQEFNEIMEKEMKELPEGGIFPKTMIGVALKIDWMEKAVNPGAIASLRYGAGIIKWQKKELKKMDTKTRKRCHDESDHDWLLLLPKLLQCDNGDLNLAPSGLPSHESHLKVGAPVMLLRNLDPPKLCKGTRLIIQKLMQTVLGATILSGKASGEEVFIPKIPLIPSDTQIDFRRLHFPLGLSFAMNVNKAQGQTLEVVGLHLPGAAFSHGQLCVGCSRGGNPENLFNHAPNSKTTNVVYHEALQD